MYSMYLKEDSELEINGGTISVTGLVSRDQEGPAFAIVTEKGAEITLKNKVDIPDNPASADHLKKNTEPDGTFLL